MVDMGTAFSSLSTAERDDEPPASFTMDTSRSGDPIIAVSPAMKRVRDLVKRAAASKLPVVLVGEANTGKELLARRIHAESKGARLVALDASFDSKDLDQSAWSGPPEKGVTLFVAEIAKMPLPLQLKVLHSCSEPSESTTPAARLVATASLEPSRRRKDDVQVSDRFRHEIYRQRGAVIIEVPPLRERRADIVPLARHFLAQVRPDLTLDEAVERELEIHDWPENLAELQTAMTEAAAATRGPVVTIDALRGVLRQGPDALALDMAGMPYQEMLEAARARLARQYFSILLRDTKGNVTHAAQRAGIGRESLHRLLKQLGLSAQEFRRR